MNVTRLPATVRKYGATGTLYAGLYAPVCLLACGVSAEGEGVAPQKKNAPAKRSKPYLPQKPLLPACIPLLKVGIRCEGVYWITNDKAIIISRNRDKPYDEHSIWGLNELWQGKAELFNRRAGKVSALAGLTRVLNKFACPHETFQLSPNGKWLAWHAWTARSGYETRMAHLDGSCSRFSGGSKHTEDYWLNGDRYVAQRYNVDPPHSSLSVFNPNTEYRVETYAPSSHAKSVIQRAFKDTDRKIEIGLNDSRLQINVFPARDYYLHYGNLYYPPHKTYTVSLPEGLGRNWDYGSTGVSHNQRKIAFSCRYYEGKSEPDETKDYRAAVFVVHADGTEFRDMGYLRMKPHQEGRLDYLGGASFSWLPDSKSLSFVYKGTLYLLPVK